MNVAFFLGVGAGFVAILFYAVIINLLTLCVTNLLRNDVCFAGENGIKHNLQYNSPLLRVTLKSIILDFRSIICQPLTQFSCRHFPPVRILLSFPLDVIRKN